MDTDNSSFVPSFSSFEDRARQFIMSQEIMRKADTMAKAGLVKRFLVPLLETVTMAAAAEETNYSARDAIRAFMRISGNRGVLEFRSIVGKLPIDDLQILDKALDDVQRFSRMVIYTIDSTEDIDCSFSVPAPAIDSHLFPYCLRSKDDMIKNIIKMTVKVKGVDPTLAEIAHNRWFQYQRFEGAAESDYTVEHALRAFRRLSGGGDSGVLVFQSIVGKLPIDDLQTLEKLLEGKYHEMLISDMGTVYLPPKAVKAAAAPGGGDSVATKLAGQAIGVMVAKVIAGAFETPTTDLEPFEKAAGAVGLISVVSGLLLQGKKPGLSKSMLKFGSVVISLNIIWSMAGNLENNILSWFFGLLSYLIVAVTATFA